MPRGLNGKRRKGSQHDKTGCLTCRYRRKKCTQNTFPVCGTCARLNLECIRESPRNVLPPYFLTDIASQGEDGASHKSEATLLKDRFAMRYYINELASHFSVSSRSNSFLSELLPMAMQSQALREAILSLALSHLSLADLSYESASREARARAIAHLTSAIDSPQRNAIWSQENASACLTLVMGLTTTSNGRGWYSHLQVAAHLILSAEGIGNESTSFHGPEYLGQTAEGRCVLRKFAYHDVLGCVTVHTRPLISPEYIDSISDEVDSNMGVGTRLLKYIGGIQILAFESSVQNREGYSQGWCSDFRRKWTQIEKDLHDWDCCAADGEQSIISLAHAYRNAALILLYRLMARHANACLFETLDQSSDEEPNACDPAANALRLTYMDLLHSKISFQVSEIMRYISAISVGSAPEAAILFPLFIAGGEAHDQNQQEEIRLRLQQSFAKRNFCNIKSALEVLENVWRRERGAECRLVAWEEVLRELGWEVILT